MTQNTKLVKNLVRIEFSHKIPVFRKSEKHLGIQSSDLDMGQINTLVLLNTLYMQYCLVVIIASGNARFLFVYSCSANMLMSGVGCTLQYQIIIQ